MIGACRWALKSTAAELGDPEGSDPSTGPDGLEAWCFPGGERSDRPVQGWRFPDWPACLGPKAVCPSGHFVPCLRGLAIVVRFQRRLPPPAPTGRSQRVIVPIYRGTSGPVPSMKQRLSSGRCGGCQGSPRRFPLVVGIGRPAPLSRRPRSCPRLRLHILSSPT